MTRQHVQRRILRGVGANALSQGVGVLVQLIGLPVFLSVWGVAEYGDWLVLTSWVAFLALSDVGLATAAANEMTMRVGADDRQAAVSVFQSTWVLLSFAGLVILGLVAVAVHATPVVDWIPLRDVSRTTAASVMTILAAQVLVVQQTGLLHAGFRCDGNYALGQSLSALARLLEFVAYVLAACLIGSMVAVALAGLLARTAAWLIFWAVLHHRSPWLRLGVAHANGNQVRRLAPAAVAFLGMPLGHALGSQGMIQVIAATLGSTAVVVYAAHRTIANVVTQLINVINLAVWPELSTAFGSGDKALMRGLHRSACKWAFWIAVPTCLLLLLVAPILLPIWSRGQVQLMPALLAVFLLIIVVRSIWRTSAVVPLATNRHQLLATLLVAGNAAACGAACYLGPAWGLVGVALASAGVDLALLLYVTCNSLRAVQDRPSQFFWALLAPPIQLAGQGRSKGMTEQTT